MASRRASAPDERDVSDAILDAINHMDTNAIAHAILDDRRIADCIDQDALQTYDLADVLAYAIPDAIGTDAITDSIMMYLKDLKFSSESVPQPSPVLDATMLREQILGEFSPPPAPLKEVLSTNNSHSQRRRPPHPLPARLTGRLRQSRSHRHFPSRQAELFCSRGPYTSIPGQQDGLGGHYPGQGLQDPHRSPGGAVGFVAEQVD